jgi:hypothetical protein
MYNHHKKNPHLQSWFIGMRPRVFQSDQFDEFIRSVEKHDKGMVIHLYEHGFTRLLKAHNGTFAYEWSVGGHTVYNQINKYFRRGFPFMKKINFSRKHGALGRQMKYVLDKINPIVSNAILENATRIYGEKYIKWILTNNPIKILFRNTHHILSKLFKGGL